MIELVDKQIRIDGAPRLVISGEVHYFRLPPESWDDRIRKLKAAGANAVASYIPWLCHELEDGTFDFEGRSRPELDLVRFMDLVRSHDLFFIARPGPFVMAELKNEGIPYRLYREHPEIVPVTWDGKQAPTRTLDYLAPAFLAEVRRWYHAVLPHIAPHLQTTGGNTIALQLDNEIGMLSWVSNSPDLTDGLVDDFWAWLGDRRDAYPFPEGERFGAIRSPETSWSARLMRDLGHYMRDRFARYVATLRGYAEECGIREIPFIVNIHGTEAGGGAPFPLGISQLYESYTQEPGYIGASDHYLGDLNGANAADWYLMNAFMEAVNRPEQPLASVEFEAGSGDYSGGMAARLDPSALDFKLRMAIAQGNRLINYYLFTGGYNYRMERATGDGNERISFTGERHGTAAPVNPEGRLNYTYPRLARATSTLLAHEASLADASEERDAIAVAFIPDYFMTESRYPGNDVMPGISDHLQRHRFGGPGQTLIRALQQQTYRFSGVDIQHRDLDPATVPVLVLASARYMENDLQEKLVRYLHDGGRLLLQGEVPRFDMLGNDSTVLCEALGLTPVGDLQSDHQHFLSVEGRGWATGIPELRVGYAQTFTPDDRAILSVYGRDEAAAFDIAIGQGRAIVLTCDPPLDFALFGEALARLGAEPGLRHDCDGRNIFLTSTINPRGERFIHLLNFDGFAKSFQVMERGKHLFDGRALTLAPREGTMLPLDLIASNGVRVAWSTAEVVARRDQGLRLRRGVEGAEILLHLPDGVKLEPVPGCEVEEQTDGTLVRIQPAGARADVIDIAWQVTT